MNIFFEDEVSEEQRIEELSFNPEQIATKVIEAVLERYQCPYECSVNVYLKDENEIKDINSEYRDIDKVTDVLSFPNVPFEQEYDFSILDDDSFSFEYFDPDSGELLLGDILICYKRMIEQAKEYNHCILREYAFLVAHSMLHLLGFDHINDDERMRMENAQNEILNSLGITRD